MTVKQFKERARQLTWASLQLCEDIGFNEKGEVNRLCVVAGDEEATYIKEWASKLCSILDYYATWANYMNRPFTRAGKLRLLETGEYALADEVLQIGTHIEVYMPDETGREKWSHTTIEHNGKHYYFSCNGKKLRQGIFARMK